MSGERVNVAADKIIALHALNLYFEEVRPFVNGGVKGSQLAAA
jgi:hypothetical protein